MKEYNAHKEVNEMLNEKIDNIEKKCDRNTLYVSDAEKHMGEMRKDISNFKQELKTEMSDVKTENIKQHKEIMDILKPIAETYKGISFLGGTMTKILVVLGLLTGAIIGCYEVIKMFLKR